MLRRKILPLLLLTILVATNIVQEAGAFDRDFYGANDIIYYNPDALNGCGSALNGKDNIEKALTFYMGKGLTLAQAAGIVGNFIAESGVDPRKEQGGKIVDDSYVPKDGVGFGIAQWTFSTRQIPLENFMKSQVPPVGITDLGGQLGFSWQELQTTHSKALQSVLAQSDPIQAAFVFHRDYEGSADSLQQILNNRGGNAQKLYDQYKNSPPVATVGGSSATSDSGCSNGTLSDKVLSYAWPTYRGLTTVAQQGWTDAVKQAQSSGMYVGGSAYPGIDCGAFVTLLLINSGFEPNYNYGDLLSKGAGNTDAQEKWLRENWQSLGTGATINPANLQPGDVAIKSSFTGQEGHTFVWVGKVAGFGDDPAHGRSLANGNPEQIASASLDERAPMADVQSPTDSHFNWYRKK